jgi:hypothetical protein
MNILYDVRAAAAALSMGRTLLFREIKAGRIKPLRHHPKVVFHRDELERYAAALRDSASTKQASFATLDPRMIAHEEPSDI